MVNRAVLSLFGFFVVFGVFGCSSEVAVEPGMPVCMSLDSRLEAMKLCEDVLVRMYFEIEKFDTDKGYIKTRPLRGAQFFEFWRIDNAGSENASMSNLQSVLRTAELQLAETDGRFCVECKVHMRRLAIEETDVADSSKNTGIFSGSRTFQKLHPDTENLEWIDLGPDTALEKRILGRIMYKVKKVSGK
ncbi:MAG: hypothetical protein K9M75_12530 [Phycisphaerae bacterium]|nr:hypothetical protein [Phycisphaerae bacterium]